MSIYWNAIILDRLSKKTNVTEKYRVTTDFGRIYIYYIKDCKNEDSEMTVKIIIFPKKEFPLNK